MLARLETLKDEPQNNHNLSPGSQYDAPNNTTPQKTSQKRGLRAGISAVLELKIMRIDEAREYSSRFIINPIGVTKRHHTAF
ncbi:hypothetical protein FF011L_22710 [Roseimaritima multifibrata]|uniref:Uncharacterized protein n=1 Tax=Roseimaritima multifibrata TaxID=1930274 RepID=A0A517MF39_9BACT|nr:hypothetical protein FF011L_22710 [Roseimaritima multifibrata]